MDDVLNKMNKKMGHLKIDFWGLILIFDFECKIHFLTIRKHADNIVYLINLYLLDNARLIQIQLLKFVHKSDFFSIFFSSFDA
jgi:hypothetical protein